MAASTSRQSRDNSLSQHRTASAKPGKLTSSQKAKGKGKEQAGAAPKQTTQSSHSTADNSALEPEWEWTYLTDSTPSTIPPIFTQDGSYFFSLAGSSVKIFSVATGQVVSTLTSPRSTGASNASSDLLTSAILNPHNAFQLITGSLNGTLMVWDFLEAIPLQVIDISQPIHHICAHDSVKDAVFVTASRPSKNKLSGEDNAVVLRVSLKVADATSRKSSEILAVGKIRAPAGLAFSPSGGWLVAVAGHKVYVAASASLKSGFTKYVSPERLTCLAFHPSEDYFATGDNRGNVRLWYCLNGQIPIAVPGVEKKTQTTLLHWHAHAISSLTFTANGAYLLSGGEESVLVIWQVQTGKKEFVPRLGAPIKTVSVCRARDGEEEYLVGLADSTHIFVSAATLKISRICARIKLDPATSHDRPSTSNVSTAPLAVHSTTSTLLLPSSHPSSLQIYSPSSSTLISELEVSPSNRVSRRDEKYLEPSRVEQTVISSSGDWMASIDSREGDDDFRGESYLKLWWWDRKAGFWILNTRIDRPHGPHKITAVTFSPSSSDYQPLYLATTGNDGNAKTWRIRTTKSKTGVSEDFWVARSTCGFRGQNPKHASWSPDSSLLAICLGQVVALYDPSTNILRRALTVPECKIAISARFVGKAGRYLALVGERDLVLWDLITQAVSWHYTSPHTINHVVPHHTDDTLALVHHPSIVADGLQTRISIFCASSPKPTRVHSVPFGLRNVIWYPLRPPSSTFALVGITQDWKVVVVGDSINRPAEEGSAARELVSDTGPQKRTIFKDIFGESAFTDLSNESPSLRAVPSSVQPWASQGFNSVFDGPAHLMPSLESVFDPLMARFLKPRSNDATIPPSTRFDDEDEVMDVEDTRQPVAAGTQRKRVVEQEELDRLADLFKMHTVKSKPHLHVGPIRKNGISHGQSNGAGGVRQNGVSGFKSTPFAQSPVDRQVPSLSPPAPTTIIAGKKRKQSLG